jgi:large subunit ribosomal protein L31
MIVARHKYIFLIRIRSMKKGIHPLKRKISIVMTDGSFFDSVIVATYNKNILKLDVDTKKHPCWNPSKELKGVDSGNRLHKFQSKYKV